MLNVTSTKKQDNMLPTVAGIPGSFTTAPGGAGIFVFCPTYRRLEAVTVGEQLASRAGRTATQCFAKGIKETINFNVQGPSPVRWRRMVVSLQNALIPISHYQAFSSTLGYSRPMDNLAASPDFVALTAAIFEGTQNNDWFNIFDAKLDTNLLRVHQDRNIIVNNGNQTGSTRIIKNWIPINKNLRYGDDEFGEDMISTGLAAPTRGNLGNVFIIDFFEPTIGTDTVINFNPHTTYYWHEK